MGGILSSSKPKEPELTTEEDFNKRVNELLIELEAFRDGIDREPSVAAKKAIVERDMPFMPAHLRDASFVTDDDIALEMRELELAIKMRYRRCSNVIKAVLKKAVEQNIRSVKVQYTSIGKSRFGDRKDARNSPKKLHEQLTRDVLFFHETCMHMRDITKVLRRLDKKQGKKVAVALLPVPKKKTRRNTLTASAVSPTGASRQKAVSPTGATQKAQ